MGEIGVHIQTGAGEVRGNPGLQHWAGGAFPAVLRAAIPEMRRSKVARGTSYENIVDMHIRVFFRLLHPDISAVHNSLRLAALDPDDIRHDQLHSLHQLEFAGVAGDVGEEGFGGVRDSGGCSDLFVLDVQVGLLRFDLPGELMIVCLLLFVYLHPGTLEYVYLLHLQSVGRGCYFGSAVGWGGWVG